MTLFDQGILQVVQAAVTGLEPGKPYMLALTENPAGAAIVNSVGPLRQLDRSGADSPRRYLVIVAGHGEKPAAPVQLQQ